MITDERLIVFDITDDGVGVFYSQNADQIFLLMGYLRGSTDESEMVEMSFNEPSAWCGDFVYLGKL